MTRNKSPYELEAGDKVRYTQSDEVAVITEADRYHVWIGGDQVRRSSIAGNFENGTMEYVGQSPAFHAFN